jgi:CubicO group peptidase (beta-lactamase class C family)
MKTRSIILLLLSCQLSFAQQLRKSLEEIKEKNNLVGLTVCVVKDGEVINLENLGLRDVNRNLPLDNNTVFRIASVSKMFTVTALMQLYDKGLFKLDEDVSTYLGFKLRNPNYPDEPITFSMLMSHTSSLRDGEGYDKFLMASYNQKPFPLLSSVLVSDGPFFTSDMWSNTDAPSKGFFTYSNINFGILGTLVERLSGERFDKYCIEHLFKPMNIHASFDVRDISDVSNVGVIYRKENGNWTAQNDDWKGVRPADRELTGYVIGSNAVLFAPQGGLRVSASDLAKFLMMHQNNGNYKGVKILSEKAAQLMHKTVWSFNGKNGNSEKEFFTHYSLGCMRTDKLVSGVELLGHSGDAYGLLSGLYYSEKEKFGIIFITNGGEWKPGSYSGWQSVEEDVFKACYDYIRKQ